MRGASRMGSVVWRASTSRMGMATIGSTGLATFCSLQYYAKVSDFFEYSFTTRKDTDAIVDFYSTEDFLQILGVVPLGLHLILAGVEWDTKAENTMHVWNTMQISFDITEKEEEIDGKDVVTFFNKRERFVQYVPFTHFLLWDQVQNYGYQRFPDGTIKVTHQGENFYGPWPVRFLVQLHAQYVVWATEKHINSAVFGTEDLEGQEHQRSNIPLHVAQQWLAELQGSQEAALTKAGANASSQQKESAAALKRLIKRKSSMSVERKADGTLKLHVDDPEAKAAIKSALKDIKAIEGNAKAAGAISSLLRTSEVGGVKDKVDGALNSKLSARASA